MTIDTSRMTAPLLSRMRRRGYISLETASVADRIDPLFVQEGDGWPSRLEAAGATSRIATATTRPMMRASCGQVNSRVRQGDSGWGTESRRCRLISHHEQ